MLLDSVPFFQAWPGQLALILVGVLLFALSYHPLLDRIGINGDGSRTAKRIRRIRSVYRAEKLYLAFMNLPDEERQHTNRVLFAYHSKLLKADSERAEQFRESHPSMDGDGFQGYFMSLGEKP